MKLVNLLLMLLLLLLFLVFEQCLSFHILVTSLTQSYGEWNQLLHISKEILSRKDHFITFIIEESHDHWLNAIRNENFNSSSYQIIYTPTETRLDAIKMRAASTIQMITLLLDHSAEMSFNGTQNLITFLYSTEHDLKPLDLKALDRSLNKDLIQKHNDISSITLNSKIDVCLLDELHPFAMYVCDAFNIPTIMRAETSLLSSLEYHDLFGSSLYVNDIWYYDDYPNDLINGTVMSYSQRLKNILKKIAFRVYFKFYSFSKTVPMIQKLNNKLDLINKSMNIKNYNDGYYSIWNKVAIISGLGPPYSTVFYSRPRIKQFGFLLYPTKTNKTNQANIMEWVNKNNSPILYISMGSVHSLPNNALHHIYINLINHSKQNGYRVLWALRQNIYENITNHQLQRPHFQIMKWIPQMQVLQHKLVKAFLTHSGGNGVLEGLYSKTAMILYPRADDQFFNARRIEEVECGLQIKDREQFTDLTEKINVLMLDKSSSAYFQNNLNLLHKMLTKNGGVSEAVDFVEYAAEFGIKHLLCTLGNKYNCNDRITPWYQKTIIDIYLIIIVIILINAIIIRQFYARLFHETQTKKHKTE